MIRKLLFALAVLLTAGLASAQPNLNYSFARDNQGVPIIGRGLRPTVTGEMGIPPGTPFYDTSTFLLYYWSGSAWTAVIPGATFSGPVLVPDGTAAAPSIGLASDADGSGTGLFRSGADAIGVSTAGTERWIFNSSGGLVPLVDDSYTVGSSTINARSLSVSRVIQGSKTLSLTDAGATVAFARVAVPTAGFAGGTVIYTATSTDATDQLTTTGMAYFAGVDKAGTVTCGSPSVLGTVATAYTKGNTLVCTLSAATSTTNCDLKVTCTDNTAGTQTVNFYWRLDMPISNTVAPQ